jgi:hypothetical protein
VSPVKDQDNILFPAKLRKGNGGTFFVLQGKVRSRFSILDALKVRREKPVSVLGSKSNPGGTGRTLHP